MTDKATEIQRMCEFLSKKGWHSNVRKHHDGSFSTPLFFNDIPNPGRNEYDRFDVIALLIDFNAKKLTAYFAKESGHNGDTYDEKRVDVPWNRLDGLYDKIKTCALRYVIEDVKAEEKKREELRHTGLAEAKLQEIIR